MSSIDSNYYDSFDGASKPFYDWEKLIINAGCESSAFGIDDPESCVSDSSIVLLAKLIHEYTHYCQNFTTTWGVSVFTDFALSMIKVGASSASSTEQVHLPLEDGSELLLSGLELRRDTLIRMNAGDSCCTTTGTYDQDEMLISVSEGGIVHIGNGRFCVGVGSKAIREHMAHLCAQVFLGKSDQEISENNSAISTDNRSLIPWSKQHEYWMLFEYFRKIGMTDVAVGVIQLATIFLATIQPQITCGLFFKWMSLNIKELENQCLPAVVSQWLLTQDAQRLLVCGFNQSKRHCEGVREIARRNSAANDFLLYISQLLDLCLSNLARSNGGRDLLSDDFEISSVQSWKRLMATYGTGVIRYLDGAMLHGNSEYVKTYMDPIIYYCSAGMAFRKLIDDDISQCPFYEEVPICTAECRSDQRCFRKPFLVMSQVGNVEHCLLANAIRILGFTGRLSS